MGMFDYITIQVELPKLSNEERDTIEWQTKSLYSYLEHYTITDDGRLLRKVKSTGRLVDTYHDGEITFYGILGEGKQTWRWIQYTADFEDGQLFSMVQIKDEECETLGSCCQ